MSLTLPRFTDGQTPSTEEWNEIWEAIESEGGAGGASSNFAPDPDTTIGLVWGTLGGMLRAANGSVVLVPATQIVLTPGAANHIEVSEAGVISAATGGFSADKKSIEKCTTDGSVITTPEAERNRRVGFDFGAGGGGGGSAGPAGAPGSMWRSGTVVPADALGINGDYYLNAATGAVYTKSAGVYALTANIRGPQGIAGGSLNPRGVWSTATAYVTLDSVQAGTPASSYQCLTAHTSGSTTQPGVGADWETYWRRYAEAGATGAAGAAGASGTAFRSGSGVPSNSLGVNGDYYLNTATGDIYQRSSGTYAIVANIMGPPGEQGEQGEPGDPGPAGPDGGNAGTLDGHNAAYFATASDLAAKAPLDSPVFSGTPAVPNVTAGDNSTKAANTAFVAAELAALVNSAPDTLDTLGELASALEDADDVVTGLTSIVGGKAAKAANLSDLSDAEAARTNLGLGDEELSDRIALGVYSTIIIGDGLQSSWSYVTNELYLSATPSDGGGSSATDGTTSFSTSSLAYSADATGTIAALGKSGYLRKFTLNRAARLRLYATAGDRTADAARPSTTPGAGVPGLIAEFVSAPGALTANAGAPVPFYYSGDATRVAAIYYRVQCLDPAGGIVTTNLDYTQIQA